MRRGGEAGAVTMVTSEGGGCNQVTGEGGGAVTMITGEGGL